MSDAAAVVMSVCAALGAWTARPIPLWLALVAGLLAFIRRWPMLLWLAVALAASGLAARSWSGLHPATIGEWSGQVKLVTDPAEAPDGFGSLTFIARVQGKRLQVYAHGPAATTLKDALAGDQIALEGYVSRLPKLPATAARQLAARHVSGRLTVMSTGVLEEATGPARVTNGLRRTLVRGALSMPAERRALFTGFVLGDNRGQSSAVVADFRASGLAHLLVVSGENVAFVLALVSPLLGRLSLPSRLVAGLVVLGVFGVLTRWEPSVLRAEAMAVIGLVAVVLGRPASAIRLLALAVTALIVVDPLLVGSTSFALSVGASAGLALLAKPLADALPGPRPIATALAVTVAAQVGVAPAFLPAFGGLPVATLPANLVALPAAGPVMMWGLAAGLPAGLIGGPVARALHAPTSLAIGWVAGVARVAARLPLGRLGWPHLVAIGVAAVSLVVAARRGRRFVATLALLAGLTAIAEPGVAIAVTGQHGSGRPIAAGVQLWRVGSVVVVLVERARPADALTALHTAAVDRIDLLIVGRGGRAAADDVRKAIRVGDAEAAHPGDAFAVGDLTVRIAGTTGHLVVELALGTLVDR